MGKVYIPCGYMAQRIFVSCLIFRFAMVRKLLFYMYVLKNGKQKITVVRFKLP